MEISPAVASVLALLSGALDEPSDDLARRVTALSATVRHMVPSYLGLTLHLREDPRVRLTSMISADNDDEAVVSVPVSTSLLIPRLRLDPASNPAQGPSTADHVGLVLYAGRPGAFVDLAADLALLTGTDLGVVLDRHLSPPPDSASALEQESTINQVIGVLIGRGHTPHQAWAHLGTRATLDRTDRWTASTRLLADLLPANPPSVRGTTAPEAPQQRGN